MVRKGTAWGRRAYVDKEARELLNDISRRIARDPPDHVDDVDDLSLSDVLKSKYVVDTKATTLAGLLEQGLSFEESVCWYWFRHAQFSMTDIHYAIQSSTDGGLTGGDPSHRRNSVRNIQRILESAAFKLPDVDADDVPNLADVLDEHDRADAPTTDTDDTDT